jgi:toxin FitB
LPSSDRQRDYRRAGRATWRGLSLADANRRRGLRPPSGQAAASSALSLLVDTNVLSELRKGDRASTHVRAWFEDVPPEEIFLSVLVVGELRRGIESIRRRHPKQAAALERWLARITIDHSERILPIDGQVADQWGRLTPKRPGSVIDTLMAATALVHGLVLVTRNVKDVEWTGVSCRNPFEPGPKS